MINPDLPIKSSSEDRLNRNSFADSLAKAILEYEAPYSFSIGLYGEWGSGKTSLLNMVLEKVETQDDGAVILRFNPWLCSDPQQLISQFFKQMATAIKLKKPVGDTAWALIDQYADVLDATSIIPVAGPAIAAAGRAVASNAKRHVTKRANDLQGSKDRIVGKLASDNTKIIVAIDDIDRLSEEEIISVFQLVKALADFPNTVYLLAFDYNVVITALSKVQHGDGKEYLEKVIQVPFEIPAPNMQSIQETLFSKLNEIIGEIPNSAWDKYTWAELYQYGIKYYIRSIRDVIRYVNVYYLKYQLLKSETNPVDLLGLTCLQVFEPLVYSRLPSIKEYLCGVSDDFLFRTRKERDNKINEIIDSLFADQNSTVNQTAARHILYVLFPKIKEASGTYFSSGRQYDHNSFLLNNNIAERVCFDRYFSLTLEDDAIATATINYIIFEASEEDFKRQTTSLYKEGKITRFLEQLEAYAYNSGDKQIPSERACVILKWLSQQWHTFKVDDIGFFTIPFRWRLLFCVDRLLNLVDVSERGTCMKDIFNDQSVQPTTLALILEDFENAHGRFTDKEPNEGKQKLTLEDVIELEELFKKRAVDALDTRAVLNEYQGLYFVWMLNKLDSELTARKKKELVTDTNSLVKVIGYCMSRGVTTTSRDSYKTWSIRKETLSEYYDSQEAFKRMTSFIRTKEFLELNTDDQMNITAFILIMSHQGTEIDDRTSVSEEAINRKMQEITETHRQTGHFD